MAVADVDADADVAAADQDVAAAVNGFLHFGLRR